MQKIKQWPLFPFLLSLFPILSLWASNAAYIAPWTTVRIIAITLIMQVIIYWLFRLVYHSSAKAAILSTILSMAFFTYGHIYGLIEDRMVFGVNVGRHRYLLLAVVLVILLAAFWLSKSKIRLQGVVPAANLIAAVALIYPVYGISAYHIQSMNSAAKEKTAKETTSGNLKNLPVLAMPRSGYQPDIYYIILDSYAREDVLEECFSYDNRSFLSELRNLGFYIADDSVSNFTITDLSVAASLNMEYPQNIGEKPEDASDTTNLKEWIGHSAVRTALENAGYQTVSFDSGYPSTRWSDAAVYYNPEGSAERYFGGLNPFESMLLKTTMGVYFYDARSKLPDSLKMMLDSAYIRHRARMLNIFEKLEVVPEITEPTFTFAHFLAPHNPFVFGKDGEFVSRNTPFTLNDDPEMTSGFEYIDGYVNQLIYVNTRTLEVVKAILDKSEQPPIIIIQGDHGPSRWITSKSGRSYILNAYYIPDGYDGLYPEISPVNTFRVIFNTTFGASMPLLEDESFYSTHSTIDQLTPIENEKRKCNPAYVK